MFTGNVAKLIGIPIAKAYVYCKIDTYSRKFGEQKGFETPVVQTVNDVYLKQICF